MNTLEYILKKNDVSFDNKTPMPIAISNVGRRNLALWLHELDFKTGVEVGVAAGEYSETLAAANPQMKLYGIDPFVPHSGYRDYTRKETFKELYEEAHGRLDKFKNYKFIKKFSVDAAADFSDDSLDFVYIDANHSFVTVTNDIFEWSKKVKRGGIIAGHDFRKDVYQPNYHVWYVVNAYTDAYGIKPWFVLGEKEASKGEIRDKPRSWLWVKG